MSTRKTPPSTRKPGQAPAPSRRSVPLAAHTPARTAGGRTAARPRRDLFGLYFVLGSATVILLFGVAVWGFRTLVAGSPPPATATPELLTALPRETSNETPLPLTPPATPTLPAPDAINSGAFAPSAPI